MKMVEPRVSNLLKPWLGNGAVKTELAPKLYPPNVNLSLSR